jgi:hypothetical protein
VTEPTDISKTLHIYTRVSTAVQAEQGTSLDSQRELGIEKAKQLGFEYKVWDEGFTTNHASHATTKLHLSFVMSATRMAYRFTQKMVSLT